MLIYEEIISYALTWLTFNLISPLSAVCLMIHTLRLTDDWLTERLTQSDCIVSVDIDRSLYNNLFNGPLYIAPLPPPDGCFSSCDDWWSDAASAVGPLVSWDEMKATGLGRLGCQCPMTSNWTAVTGSKVVSMVTRSLFRPLASQLHDNEFIEH